MFDFTHAIVRTPPATVSDGLRANGGEPPSAAVVLAEHYIYVDALRGLRLSVEILPAADTFPDSVFLEDPALVFSEGAILLRLAAPSRAGETSLLAPTLERRFDRVLSMAGPGHADGGDVLVLPDKVVIGLSDRTDRDGAEELAGLLDRLGKRVLIARTPPGVLHFKTGCGLIDAETVFALPQMIASEAFDGLRVLPVPEGEAGAANILRIRDRVLIGEEYPNSREAIEKLGIATLALPTREIARLDAGLSCMSLRWKHAA